MSSISMSSGEGSSRSSRRPDSMRCQARGASAPTGFGLPAISAAVRCRAASRRRERGVAVAVDQMVVDHADRLHERVHDGRATKFEASRGELLGDRARQRRLGRHLRGGAEVIDLRHAVDEVPQQRESRAFSISAR